MTQDEIIEMARQAGFDIGMWEKLSDNDDVFGYDFCGIHENLEAFAKLVAEHERERIYLEQMQLPEPRLTGKFSITAGKFKCTGCTGTWTDRDDAKHHSCKDYQ